MKDLNCITMSVPIKEDFPGHKEPFSFGGYRGRTWEEWVLGQETLDVLAGLESPRFHALLQATPVGEERALLHKIAGVLGYQPEEISLHPPFLDGAEVPYGFPKGPAVSFGIPLEPLGLGAPWVETLTLVALKQDDQARKDLWHRIKHHKKPDPNTL